MMNKYFIILMGACLMGDRLFGANEILQTRIKNVAFKTRDFDPGRVDSFTVAQNSAGYWCLIGWAGSVKDTILKTRLKGTAVKKFNPGGGYISYFTATKSGDTVFFKAYSTNGPSSDTIFKTMRHGIAARSLGTVNNSVIMFEAYKPVGYDTTFLKIGKLATEFIGWECLYRNGVVEVNWATQIETSVNKWVVDRKEEGDVNYTSVGEKASQGGGNYVFVDSTVCGGRWYWYRLGEFSGNDTIWHDEQKVWVPARIKVPLSLSVIPNPVGATSKLRLRYSVPGVIESSGKSISPSKEISLKVYDSSGRVIRTLIDEQRGAGYYSTDWDLKTDNGREVASGTYFVKLEVQSDGEKKELKKVIVVR